MKRWCATLLVLWLAGCHSGENRTSPAVAQQAEARLPVVYAVNYPLAWFAEQIAGDAATVIFPVPTGVDPAHWQPSPEEVLEYQEADLILANGAGYADWIRFASLSRSKLVETTRSIESRLLSSGGSTHSHGPGGAHEHDGVASHTWIDPALAGEQARAVAEALARVAPESAGEFDGRRDALLARLHELDGALTQAFADLSGNQIFYSHPVYHYLDARFQLDGKSFVWEPDVEPDEAEWQKLERILDRSRNALMLWESAPLESVVARLRAMGVTAVVYETGANPDPRVRYDSLLERNAIAIQRASTP
jgi:zinc transport system substrate-binding protein